MLNILLVEDNSFFAERMLGLLRNLDNIKCLNYASDYTEASRIVKDEMPDLVLLDINLPGRNGIELLREIKKSRQASKVVMLTNHTEEYYQQLCMEIGADYFFDKSKDFSRVPEIVNQLNG